MEKLKKIKLHQIFYNKNQNGMNNLQILNVKHVLLKHFVQLILKNINKLKIFKFNWKIKSK